MFCQNFRIVLKKLAEGSAYLVYNKIYNGKNLHRPKIFIFGTKTYLYELICHPQIEEDQTKPVCFMKKINLIKKNLINLKFLILPITMELHCNAKSLKSQINQFFLIKLIFSHKTDWMSLVLLYMWVTYELIETSFSAKNEDFRFLEIWAIINPIVN